MHSSIHVISHASCSSALQPGPQWTIRLFGGLRVSATHDGQPLALQGKQRDLLTLLTLDRLRPHGSAARYGDTLWPESDGAAARSNLDSVVHRLRRSLGSTQAVHVREGRVWLDESICTSDLDELVRLGDAVDLHGERPCVETLEDLASRLLALSDAGGVASAAGLCARGAPESMRAVLYLWRSVTRELALRLDAAGRPARAIRLCERYMARGDADPGLLRLWVGMLERTGQPIAAVHVAEEFGRPMALM